MADPAVEAAKKAWNGAGVYRTIAENAAREALKPIQDVIENKSWSTGGFGCVYDKRVVDVDDLISLIYPSEEL